MGIATLSSVKRNRAAVRGNNQGASAKAIDCRGITGAVPIFYLEEHYAP
jgi:hypothetical protein